MTNYNERPDDLTRFMKSIGWAFDENGYTFDDNYINFRTANILRQAITSLMKELVAEAKPELPALFAGLDDISVVMYKKGTDEFEQNLLKALEEV